LLTEEAAAVVLVVVVVVAVVEENREEKRVFGCCELWLLKVMMTMMCDDRVERWRNRRRKSGRKVRVIHCG